MNNKWENEINNQELENEKEHKHYSNEQTSSARQETT
jgi:hypothetical protein